MLYRGRRKRIYSNKINTNLHACVLPRAMTATPPHQHEPTRGDDNMDMVHFDELLNCLVDNAAETAFDGHVGNCWFDVVLCNPLQALGMSSAFASIWIATECEAQSAKHRNAAQPNKLSIASAQQFGIHR